MGDWLDQAYADTINGLLVILAAFGCGLLIGHFI